MQKTFKNHELIGINQAIGLLMQTKLPVKTSWNLCKNASTIENVLKTFIEAEKNLVEHYAEKDDDGNIIQLANGQPKIKNDCLAKFQSEHNELLNIESDIELFSIQLSDLIYTVNDKCETVEREIAPNILYPIMPLVVDEK